MTDDSDKKAYLFKTLGFNIGINKFDTKGFSVTGIPLIDSSSSPEDAVSKLYVDAEIESLRRFIESKLGVLVHHQRFPQYREVVLEFSSKKTNMGFAAPVRLTDFCDNDFVEGTLYHSISLITMSTRINLMTSSNKELQSPDNTVKKDLAEAVTIRIKGKKGSAPLLTFQTKRVSQRYKPDEPVLLDYSFLGRVEILPQNFNKIFSTENNKSVRTVTSKVDSIRLTIVFVLDLVYKFTLSEDGETTTNE